MHFSKGDNFKYKYQHSSSSFYFPSVPPLPLNPSPHDSLSNSIPTNGDSNVMISSPHSSLPFDSTPQQPLVSDQPSNSNIQNSSSHQGSSIISLRPPPRPPSLKLNEEESLSLRNITLNNTPPSQSLSASTVPSFIPLSILPSSSGESHQQHKSHSEQDHQQPPLSARSIRFNLEPLIHQDEREQFTTKHSNLKPRVPSVSFPSNPITIPPGEDPFEMDSTQKEKIAKRPKTPRTPELALNSDYVSRDWTKGEEESKETGGEKKEESKQDEKITSSLSLARFLKRKSKENSSTCQNCSRQDSAISLSEVQPVPVINNNNISNSRSVVPSSKELKALKQKEKERLSQEKLQAKIEKIKREVGSLSTHPKQQLQFPECDQFVGINPQYDMDPLNHDHSGSNLRNSIQHLKPLPSIPTPQTPRSGKIHFMALYFKDRFKKDSTNPLTVNRSLSEEFKKVPYLTILLSIVQILMFVVSISIGGLESVIVNPFIGPPEETMILLGAKKGQLIISPNWQLYRLVTPVFLHGGIVHLCLNLLWQLTVMLPLEKHWGIMYVGFIYFMSALGGNLLSALFLPQITTIGASSALFGILGAIYADLWMNWRFMPQPKKDFVLLTFQVVAQIIVGLIPWIDNFAHCGGLMVGFLTTLATIPRMRDLNPYEESMVGSSNGGGTNPQAKRKKLTATKDTESQMESVDLESGEGTNKSTQSKTTKKGIVKLMKKVIGGCSACCCCCFYCFTKKGRAKGKFHLWLRVVAGCMLFLYFAVFGGLYFSQLDFNCKWCYFINPDWDTLYEIFELARNKL
nr:unnamed protein product [Naegleria fowleri]